MTTPLNPLARAVGWLDRLPVPFARRALTVVFTRQVRFAGTAGLRFEALDAERAVVVLKNRRRVRNHIGGVHAAAMALLAETASGAVFGINLPGDRLPLLKSMQIAYLRRAQGDLRAVASLDAHARQELGSSEKGALTVPVQVYDESGEQPIECTFVWAWKPREQRETTADVAA